MTHVLQANIVATEPDTGAVKVFLAGEEPPEWVYEQARSAEVWEGAVPDVPDSPSPAPADGSPPPQSGPGSAKSAWADYARTNQVPVPDGATREDIITACQNAGVATT